MESRRGDCGRVASDLAIAFEVLLGDLFVLVEVEGAYELEYFAFGVAFEFFGLQ